jgi:hypothetical protein
MAAMMSAIGLPGATQAVSIMGLQKAAAATITQMGPANGAAMFKIVKLQKCWVRSFLGSCCCSWGRSSLRECLRRLGTLLLRS